MGVRVAVNRLPPASAVGAILAVVAIAGAARGQDGAGFRFGPETVDTAAHWAARANLASAVMFSGLGEPVIVSPYARDRWLAAAGYVIRPRMRSMAMVGAVYAASPPRFRDKPDFARPETLAWDPAAYARTLDAGALAWTLLKITSPEFHLDFHDDPASKLAGLMMLPQARAQSKVILERLRNADGRFAARTPDGSFRAPRARDQAAVLWAVSSLILAATSARRNYWHDTYRSEIDPDEGNSMSILVDEKTRLLVQGITGREGQFHAEQCRNYGTHVVAGVTALLE